MVKKIEFVGWVTKRGKPIKITNKKTKQVFILERWITEEDGIRKEEVIKGEYLPDDYNFVFNKRGILKYNLVPNHITDHPKEIEVYEKLGRTILGKGEVRIVPNLALRKKKKKDLDLKARLLELMEDPKYILYRMFIKRKYAQFANPSIRNLKRWNKVPKNIRLDVDKLIYG